MDQRLAAFHIVNGVGFAVGYVIVIRRPRIVSAVAWGLVLETFTILIYPDWLGLTALGEFISVSMIGHIAYGFVLGRVATQLMTKSDARSASPPILRGPEGVRDRQ